jgi:hypothetical protein
MCLEIVSARLPIVTAHAPALAMCLEIVSARLPIVRAHAPALAMCLETVSVRVPIVTAHAPALTMCLEIVSVCVRIVSVYAPIDANRSPEMTMRVSDMPTRSPEVAASLVRRADWPENPRLRSMFASRRSRPYSFRACNRLTSRRSSMP